MRQKHLPLRVMQLPVRLPQAVSSAVTSQRNQNPQGLAQRTGERPELQHRKTRLRSATSWPNTRSDGTEINIKKREVEEHESDDDDCGVNSGRGARGGGRQFRRFTYRQTGGLRGED